MLTNIDTQELRTRIDTFERRHAEMSPAEAERELVSILEPLFQVDGYSFKHTGGPGDAGIDYIAQKKIGTTDALPTTIIQYKHYWPPRRVGVNTVRELLGSALLGNNYNRAILLANTDFTRAAEDILLHDLPVKFQLMNLNSLRAWARRIERVQEGDVSPVVLAVRNLSEDLARLVAGNPQYLNEIEWRDLERLLGAVFDRLGFDVEVTPPAKDGGKDLVLTCVVNGHGKKYLVEVKHWRSGHSVGSGLVKQFVHVLASEKAEHGLFLATYGYAASALEALTEIERKKVNLGREAKIVSLCQTFVRAESGIWSIPANLPELLFAETE